VKPVIIGVIIGIVTTIVVSGSFLAILSAQQAAEEAELALVSVDFERFSDYELEMNQLQSDECWSIDFGYDERLPDSFRGLAELEKRKEAELEQQIWKIDRGISDPNNQAINDYRIQLLILEEKYIGTEYEDYFSYMDYECDNPDYQIIQGLLAEKYETIPDNTAVNKDSNWIGLSFGDFDTDLDYGWKDYNEFVGLYNDLKECVPKSNESSCLEKFKPRIEKLCSQYHPPEDNCVETTIQDFRIWLSKRLS